MSNIEETRESAKYFQSILLASAIAGIYAASEIEKNGLASSALIAGIGTVALLPVCFAVVQIASDLAKSLFLSQFRVRRSAPNDDLNHTHGGVGIQ